LAQGGPVLDEDYHGIERGCCSDHQLTLSKIVGEISLCILVKLDKRNGNPDGPAGVALMEILCLQAGDVG